MPSMDKDKFLRNYELELDKEFERDGKAAEWAPGTSAHRFWGSEDNSLALKDNDPNKDEGYEDSEATLSPDGKHLVVSTNAVIRVYHVQSRELRAELIGHQKNVDQLHFAPDNGEPTYRLFSNAQEDGHEIIAWTLDRDGKQIHRTMPFAVQDMADRALAAISSDLDIHHSLTASEKDTLRTSFCEALQVADAKNRVKDLPFWCGIFPSFGTYPISSDGRSMLYIAHGRTTQHGMRSPDELPQIVVVDLDPTNERCRLKGHTDAIMWGGWSSDGKTIATASWDEYYKIWDAHTGECRQTIGPTNGQNWSGAFSPDGKHVLLSGGGGAKNVHVAIYDLTTGKLFSELKSEGLKLKDWIRYLAWNPAGDCIAIVNAHEVVLWSPFENKIETIFALKTDGSMLKRFNGFAVIKWAQGGRKLLLQDVSYTTFVWDREDNCKWRFERPQGMALDLYARDVFYVEEINTVVSLDGDRNVRYWKL